MDYSNNNANKSLAFLKLLGNFKMWIIVDNDFFFKIRTVIFLYKINSLTETISSTINYFHYRFCLSFQSVT